MRINLLAALAMAGALAACDRAQDSTQGAAPPASTNPSLASPAPATPPPGPSADKGGPVPPAQGQVDSREPAQRKDFEQRK